MVVLGVGGGSHSHVLLAALRHMDMGGRACAFLLLPFRPVLSSPLLSSHAARGRSRARPRRGGRAGGRATRVFAVRRAHFPPGFSHARACCPVPGSPAERGGGALEWCGAGVRPCCCWIPLSSPMEYKGRGPFHVSGKSHPWRACRVPRTALRHHTTPHTQHLMLVCSRSQP